MTSQFVKRILIPVLLLALLAGCGGTGLDATQQTTCTLTLSGALSGTYPCTADLGFDAAHGLFGVDVSVSPSDPGNAPIQVDFVMAKPGTGTTGTFDFSSGGQMSAVVVSNQINSWSADNRVPTGSAQLVVDSLGVTISDGKGDEVYPGSGNGTATLKPVNNTGASGDLILSFTFHTTESNAQPQGSGGTVETLRQAISSLGGQAAHATPIAASTPGLPPAEVSPESSSATPTAVVPAPGATQAGSDTACTITLSGAVTKQLPCTVSMIYTAKDGTTAIEIASVARITNVPEAALIVTLSGEPKPAPVTYAWDNSAKQTALVYEGGIQAFNAASSDNKGASNLKLTSLEVQSTAADGGKVFTAHGSGQATLVGLSGAVNLSVSF